MNWSKTCLTATALATLAITVGAPPAGAGTVPFPQVVTAHPWPVRAGLPAPLKFGSALTALFGPGSFGPTAGPNWIGQVGWKMWNAGAHVQYPVVSVNHGATWKIGGYYLSGSWTGGGSYVTNHLVMISPTKIVAWGSNAADFTLNGGKTWYNLMIPYGPVSFVQVKPASNSLAGLELKTSGYAAGSALVTFLYKATSPSLLTWKLFSAM